MSLFKSSILTMQHSKFYRPVHSDKLNEMLEREPKRYSAYFRGWCQAFGEHESLPREESGIHWLFTEQQAGFILPQPITRQLYREVLLQRKPPPLTFGRNMVEIGSLRFALARHQEKRILDVIEHVLTSGDDFHVFLTSHLMYGTGARIITLSTKKPLSIIYKEIGTLRIRLL
jgi:hypothetical protein